MVRVGPAAFGDDESVIVECYDIVSDEPYDITFTVAYIA